MKCATAVNYTDDVTRPHRTDRGHRRLGPYPSQPSRVRISASDTAGCDRLAQALALPHNQRLLRSGPRASAGPAAETHAVMPHKEC